ncbi:MAG: two-component system, OmpR family, sensor kinase [Actinomycetota bacterium]|nr:two-component system, OmpR family, sensor kinase [Actinomycetota bacterium]
MTRKLTIALVGLVAAALVLSGAGTYALARVDARNRTRHDAEELATALGTLVQEASQQQTLRGVRGALKLQDVAIIPVLAGRLLTALPHGVTVADIDNPLLRQGVVVSGSHGSLVWAAKGVRARGRANVVVVVTKQLELLPPDATRWFLIAGLATITVAAVVGIGLARSLTRRLRDTEGVARRISDGDLSARVARDEGSDEVATLARSVNDMASTLERSRDLDRHFLLTVSHDLRTPLTSIRGYAEAISDGAAPDTPRAAAIIVSESKRLERLVADLLELAKLDASQLSLHPARVDVAEIALDTLDAFRPAAADAGVLVQSDVAGPAMADVDPDRLGQVIANLVENALKHTSTMIRVEVTTGGGMATVVVTDDGAGIAADDLPRIFDPLYVGRRTPRRQVGSGLGLAIVRQLVTAMGGDVEAANEDRGGARLVVRLPLSASSS